MKRYRIINGDCLSELKKIEKGSINLIFADPPYWMRTGGILKRVEGTDYAGCSDDWDNQFVTLKDYADFTQNWLSECQRILAPSGSIWVIGSMQCIYTIGNVMQELGFWIINDVIWHKTNPTPNFMGTRLNNSHETLIWAAHSRKAKYTFNYKTAKELNIDSVIPQDYKNGVRKQMGSVWRFPVCSGAERLKNEEGKKLHSTQKPLALLKRIINISSSVGDMVLDPFAGTFTTGAAALQCGRKFIGIEAAKEYCEYGKKRLDEEKEALGPVETSVFDIKPPRIGLKDLLNKHYLHPNEKLFLKENSLFESSGILQADGKILLSDGTLTDIHTGAARVGNKKAVRVNGFDFWYVERDGKNILINDIRKSCRREVEEAVKNE